MEKGTSGMNIVQPSYKILGIFPGEEDCLQWLERIGRTCYKSEDKITAESAPKFVRNILKLNRMTLLWQEVVPIIREAVDQATTEEEAADFVMQKVRAMLADPPHESVIEHSMMTVRFIFDRGISHEDVRHRICAFSQESTRYCNYGKGDGGINVIEVPFWDKDDPNDQLYAAWEEAMLNADQSYRHLISLGAKPQEARSVLPNSLKTELVHTANFREWRHIFRLRTSKRAHPQMREVVVPLLRELKAKPNLGLLFEDIPDPEDV
jgi:thymidylate synthase (FAD)